ncbi:hypothetical protein B0H14DRAFT_2683559 [Mycena olivaceomarginata]|nr:hypothetical protein B0H14DRAFT_2683559 [Mycena olivaceomarginata]
MWSVTTYLPLTQPLFCASLSGSRHNLTQIWKVWPAHPVCGTVRSTLQTYLGLISPLLPPARRIVFWTHDGPYTDGPHFRVPRSCAHPPSLIHPQYTACDGLRLAASCPKCVPKHRQLNPRIHAILKSPRFPTDVRLRAQHCFDAGASESRPPPRIA